MLFKSFPEICATKSWQALGDIQIPFYFYKTLLACSQLPMETTCLWLFSSKAGLQASQGWKEGWAHLQGTPCFSLQPLVCLKKEVYTHTQLHQNRQIHRERKKIAWGWEAGEVETSANRIGVFLEWWKCSINFYGDGCTTLWTSWEPLNGTL